MSVKVEEKMCMELKRLVLVQVNQHLTIASHPVITFFWGGPISATPLTSSLSPVKRKAILEVCLALSPKENKHVPCAR